MEAPSNNVAREETPNIPPLPSLVVTEILSRLPIKTVVAAKCVCKSWLNLISGDTHLAKLHRQRSATTTTELLLRPAADPTKLYFANAQFHNAPPSVDEVKISFLSNLRSNNTTLLEKNTRNDLIFANSCNGLLCFHSFDSSSALIINPITGEFIDVLMSTIWRQSFIPAMTVNYRARFVQNEHRFVTYRLGFSEKEDRFKLLRATFRAHSSEQSAEICTFEKGAKWREIGDWPYPIPQCVRSESVILEHKLHYDFLSSDSIVSGIACFDFEEEQFGVVPIPSSQHFSASNSLFGVFGGCLSLSRSPPDSIDYEIWAMKEYGVEDSWEKLFSLPYECPLPLKQLDSGEILILCRYKYAALCNPNTCVISYKRHGFDFSGVSAYSPTLLRLKDALAGYEVCIRNVDSRSRGETHD